MATKKKQAEPEQENFREQVWATRDQAAEVWGLTVQTVDKVYRPHLPPWAEKTEDGRVLIDLGALACLWHFKRTGYHPRDTCPECGRPQLNAIPHTAADRRLDDWDGVR